MHRFENFERTEIAKKVGLNTFDFEIDVIEEPPTLRVVFTDRFFNLNCAYLDVVNLLSVTEAIEIDLGAEDRRSCTIAKVDLDAADVHAIEALQDIEALYLNPLLVSVIQQVKAILAWELKVLLELQVVRATEEWQLLHKVGQSLLPGSAAPLDEQVHA